ncbi:MAG: DUF475 domain-containing protein [Flavobacteriales bacterium]|nr:DUF475 domain-containing protein [Flavobacteriales bacterium]
MLSGLITILGLFVLEVVQSVDNAVVNAHVLRTMSAKARRWFLIWGILTAVVLVRGLLPLAIVWISTDGISFLDAVRATFTSDPIASQAMQDSAHILLAGGGVFLLLLYFHWLFVEPKDPFFWQDSWFKEKHGGWFYATAAVITLVLVILIPDKDTIVGLLAGSTLFFLIDGFKKQAEQYERTVTSGAGSDLAKLAYLEMLDLSFSIDGVFGAFAFTTNVALILIGNGLGAIVVRELTIRGLQRVGKYRWLKNGAMTSIGVLGAIMVAHALGWHPPEWLPTLVTLAIIGVAWVRSQQEIRKGYGSQEST